jgi:hypothetical protein
MITQGIVKSAGKVAFIIDTDKYVNGVEGSIPVLIKSVSNLLSCATKDQNSFFAMIIKREADHFRETGLTLLKRLMICS